MQLVTSLVVMFKLKDFFFKLLHIHIMLVFKVSRKVYVDVL